jgi:hypothetical protein
LAVVLIQPQSNTSECSSEINQDSLQCEICPGRHIGNMWKLKNLCAIITTARISVYKWTEPTLGFYRTSLNETTCNHSHKNSSGKEFQVSTKSLFKYSVWSVHVSLHRCTSRTFLRWSLKWLESHWSIILWMRLLKDNSFRFQHSLSLLFVLKLLS